ncbi:MAG: SEC-C metal-binding domain-containing protein [Planctomycetota bacterium]
MQPQTYYGHLDSIKGDADAIENEKQRLDKQIARLIRKIESTITPETAPGLLWSVNLKELQRIAPLVGIPVSDLMGHSRYLRALCAKVAFKSGAISEDPKTDELLETCGTLWQAFFYREMLDDLKDLENAKEERQQRMIAGMTSLLSAIQGELTYQEQAHNRVKRLFSPFCGRVIEPALGVSVAQVCAGFERIRRLVPERLETARRLMAPVYEQWEAFKKLAAGGASNEELDNFMYNHPEREKIGQEYSAGVRTINECLLFAPSDLDDVTKGRGKEFLEAFSFVPGEGNQEFKTPYDEDIVRSRPFARLENGTFMLLDVCYCTYAPLSRLPECFDTPKLADRLRKRRDFALEDEASRLFTAVLKSAKSHRSYYIPVGPEGKLAERDLLLIDGDTVFVVESKASPLRSVKKRGDKVSRLATDVRKTVQAGYDQAVSVIEYLKSTSGTVDLFDNKGNVVSQIDTTNLLNFFPVVALDSYFGFIATDLDCWMKREETIGYPWVVDTDTLESIILKIDTPAKLTEFLGWRKNLHGIATNEDEAVFAGFYVRHGAVAMPDNGIAGSTMVRLDADYADIFEAEYFKRQGYDVEMPPEETGPPVWSMMKRDGDVIDFSIDGKKFDSVNIKTGQDAKQMRRDAAHAKKFAAGRKRPGRNDPCPCGSGRKYKKCCLKNRLSF